MLISYLNSKCAEEITWIVFFKAHNKLTSKKVSFLPLLNFYASTNFFKSERVSL